MAIFACSNIMAYIKAEMAYNSFFGASSSQIHVYIDDRHKVAEGIVLLEEFAAAFRRDVPIAMKSEIKKQQRIFDDHYYTVEREGSLQELNRSLDLEEFRDFKKLFIAVFQDMEKQFLEILDTRKELFGFDHCKKADCDASIDDELLKCQRPVFFYESDSGEVEED